MSKSINKKAIQKIKKQALSIEQYINGIKAGNVVLLSQAITLIESTNPKHNEQAKKIIEQCLPLAQPSIRIGITGTPGVGKSTFIEVLGQEILQTDNNKLAVLAIDPTSQISKGSILGDKTRMNQLAITPKAFIRPSPAGSFLGGVAEKTREIIVLCEAAGYNHIIIETVGVGQSEIAVHSMTDFFLLLLLPGGGDELQGIKRGVVEMADLIAINKTDGENLQKAKLSRRAYKNALHLFPMKDNQWTPLVINCSALKKTGIQDIIDTIANYTSFTKKNGTFQLKRQAQSKYWLKESIQRNLQQLFFNHPKIKEELPLIEQALNNNLITPFSAAEKLMKLFKNSPF